MSAAASMDAMRDVLGAHLSSFIIDHSEFTQGDAEQQISVCVNTAFFQFIDLLYCTLFEVVWEGYSQKDVHIIQTVLSYKIYHQHPVPHQPL